MTGHELAREEEVLKRQENRRLSIEQVKWEKYYQLHHNDIEGKYVI